MLGPRRFTREALSRRGQVGVVPGLAYTAAGGEILFIEAVKMPGKGNLKLTGSLGQVMKESGEAALSYLRSRTASDLVGPDFFDRHDFHVHVPAGATPKDGPSGLLQAQASRHGSPRQPLCAVQACARPWWRHPRPPGKPKSAN